MILAPRQRYGVVFATRVGESRWLCPASAWGAGGGRMGPKGWLLAGRLAASRRSKAQDTFWARASDCGRRRALCSVYHPPSEAEYYDLVQIPQSGKFAPGDVAPLQQIASNRGWAGRSTVRLWRAGGSYARAWATRRPRFHTLHRWREYTSL